jgi:hypothetical protein
MSNRWTRSITLAVALGALPLSFTACGEMPSQGGEAASFLTGPATACGPGSTMALKSNANGLYASAELATTNSPLRARAAVAQAWETYTVVDAGGGWSGLKSAANGLYVSADLNVGGALEAKAAALQGWEKFQIVQNADGSVALKSGANGFYVTATLSQTGAPLRADHATTVQGWEQFSCVPSGAAPPPPPPGRGNFPTRFAAPYVATWADHNLVNLSNSTGNKFWTLAFIINGGGSCNPGWNGGSLTGTNYGTYIADLKQAGGDVIVSFGGASGTEIAVSCPDVASTQAAYQKVIDQFHLTWIDLDIESGQESDTASVDRRNQAMHNLQVANPGLRISYTLAVDRSGLPSAQRNLLANAKANGVDVTMVNIMAMDYGPCYGDMGQAGVDAANATRSQIAALGLGSQVGVTPMIGVNDTTCENFTTSDARVLVSYAQANSFIGLLAYWVQDADPGQAYISIFKTFH